MLDFINGSLKQDKNELNLEIKGEFIPTKPLKFSLEAKAVFEVGCEIFSYYHKNATNDKYLASASLYDIKECFQGRDESSKINPTNPRHQNHTENL